MHEDWTVEAAAFPVRGRIFSIASAGCTAFALAARGASVTAVDVNPAQVEYVQKRLEGAHARAATVERMLNALRGLGGGVGWSSRVMAEFAALDDGQVQAAFWRARLDTRRFRAGLGLLLNPLSLRLAYASPLVAALPPDFAQVLRRRLARGFALHPNRENPYARFLLLGESEQPEPHPGIDVTVVRADAAEHLEASPPSSFDGFALSNVLDGASPAYRDRLLSAVRRAAAPGASLVLRSFDEPASAEEERWAARDRSLLWGSIRMEKAGCSSD